MGFAFFDANLVNGFEMSTRRVKLVFAFDDYRYEEVVDVWGNAHGVTIFESALEHLLEQLHEGNVAELKMKRSNGDTLHFDLEYDDPDFSIGSYLISAELINIEALGE